MAIGMNTPDWSQIGEMPVGGNGPAVPYGQGHGPLAAPDAVFSMQGPQDSARADIPYKPVSGRGDRLAANIVGGSDFSPAASGGYSGGTRS